MELIEGTEETGTETPPVAKRKEVATNRFEVAQFNTAREGVNECGTEDRILLCTVGRTARRLDKRDGLDTGRHCYEQV